MNTASAISSDRKWSGLAISAGVLAAFCIELMLVWIAFATGLTAYLNLLDSDATGAIPAIFLAALSVLIALFCGAWITGKIGRWTTLHSTDEAYLHAGIMWAICAVVIAAGLGPLLEMSAVDSDAAPERSHAQSAITAALDARSSADIYTTLNDAALMNAIMQRAHEYKSKLEPDPINTSMTESLESTADNPVANGPGLQRVISVETGMTSEQARNFIDAEQQAIAAAQARSMTQWEHARAAARVQAQSARKSALVFGWSSAVAAMLSFGAALSGARMGWRGKV